MKKICIVITNRSSWGRYKAVCDAIHNHKDLELQIVVAGGALNLDIPYSISDRLYCLVDGDSKESMVLTTTTLTTQLVGVFSRLKPDIVYIHGDRFEMLGVAMAASYMGIPIAHAEGGENTGCIDDKVRNAITELADIHFPVTEQAEYILRKKGKKNIYTVGSPAIDLLRNYNLDPDRNYPYIVILVHPNTSKDEGIEELVKAIEGLATHIVWVNPNFDAGSKKLLKEIHKLNVEFVKDLPPEEYYRLISNAGLLIGNTSSGIKEGAYLGTPYICLGDRQGNREIAGNTVVISYDRNRISNLIDLMFGHSSKPSYKFGDGNSSNKIVEILAGESHV